MKRGDEYIEFEEPDTSTRKPMDKRPKLMQMLKALQKDDTLIVYKVDRLARQPKELINIYFDIKDKGVDIVGLKDAYVDDQNICIYAFIACTERENVKVRTISGLNRKRANMERVGTTWYGYKLDETQICQRDGAKSEGKPYILLPNQDEQEQIKLMVELYDQGYSYGQIASELESKGHKNRSGNPPQKMAVYRILKRLKSQPPKEITSV